MAPVFLRVAALPAAAFGFAGGALELGDCPGIDKPLSRLATLTTLAADRTMDCYTKQRCTLKRGTTRSEWSLKA